MEDLVGKLQSGWKFSDVDGVGQSAADKMIDASDKWLTENRDRGAVAEAAKATEERQESDNKGMVVEPQSKPENNDTDKMLEKLRSDEKPPEAAAKESPPITTPEAKPELKIAEGTEKPADKQEVPPAEKPTKLKLTMDIEEFKTLGAKKGAIFAISRWFSGKPVVKFTDSDNAALEADEWEPVA